MDSYPKLDLLTPDVPSSPMLHKNPLYRLNKDIQHYIDEAKEGASYLLFCLVHIPEQPTSLNRAVEWYCSDMLTFIYHLFSSNPSTLNRLHCAPAVQNDEERTLEYYNHVCEFIGLKALTTKDFEQRPWTSEYWRFLHNASIVIDHINNVRLNNEFASVMLNFNILLFCERCSRHYRSNGYPESLSMLIRTSRDPIYAIYALHEHVNKVEAKGHFPFESFETLYYVKRLRLD